MTHNPQFVFGSSYEALFEEEPDEAPEPEVLDDEVESFKEKIRTIGFLPRFRRRAR